MVANTVPAATIPAPAGMGAPAASATGPAPWPAHELLPDGSIPMRSIPARWLLSQAPAVTRDLDAGRARRWLHALSRVSFALRVASALLWVASTALLLWACCQVLGVWGLLAAPALAAAFAASDAPLVLGRMTGQSPVPEACARASLRVLDEHALHLPRWALDGTGPSHLWAAECTWLLLTPEGQARLRTAALDRALVPAPPVGRAARPRM